MKKPYPIHFIKGAAVGGSLLIPGVSGGTMAMILGVYDTLIHSVSTFFQNTKENLLFLLTFSGGAALGIFLFARPLLYLVETFRLPVMYFFMGAVAGGIPMILRKARISGITPAVILYPLLGILIVLLMDLLPAGLLSMDGRADMSHMLLLAAAGVVTAVALVLPGISVSYMLLMLGMYEDTMYAITEFYLPYLLPLGLGGLLGVILTTKILERALKNHTTGTYLIILGFVLGAVGKVFPGLPEGIGLILCPLLFAVGFILLWRLSS